MANKWRKRARKWEKVARAWTDEHWKTHLRYLELCVERDALLKQVAILEESHTAAVSDYNALLAWQRGVREAWADIAAYWHPMHDPKSREGRLRQAIEGEQKEESCCSPKNS